MIGTAPCLTCDRRRRPCQGACPCLVDGRDITVHALADYCPHPDGPRFGSAAKPADWDDPKYRPPLPVATDEEIAAMLEKDRQQGPCCGG